MSENLKNKIINAIKSKNVEELLSTLKETNMFLTGVEAGDFSEYGIKGLTKKISSLIEGFEKKQKYSTAMIQIYLGDYGYSKMNIRIDFNADQQEEFDITLAKNSQNSVKNKWEQVK